MSVFEELKARVIAGDSKVTPKQLAEGRAADELAEFLALSDKRESEEREARERKEAQDAFIAGEYEDFMTTDLDPLREAYADAVRAIAKLYTLAQERRRAQSEIRRKAAKLELIQAVYGPSASAPHRVPVPDDRKRWMEQYIAGDYVKRAVLEGEGRQLRGHVLHTDEVFNELQERAEANKEAAAEHGRILRESVK
ncbi:hypothetical protein AB0H49_32055 [Nocardia sp. NPDC050713]|uniref:hypothetical protein n=1 Tax=Nocardia sp. NPDC050713 TaxID=3154511 RepID=UPI0033CA34F7